VWPLKFIVWSLCAQFDRYGLSGWSTEIARLKSFVGSTTSSSLVWGWGLCHLKTFLWPWHETVLIWLLCCYITRVKYWKFCTPLIWSTLNPFTGLRCLWLLHLLLQPFLDRNQNPMKTFTELSCAQTYGKNNILHKMLGLLTMFVAVSEWCMKT